TYFSAGKKTNGSVPLIRFIQGQVPAAARENLIPMSVPTPTLSSNPWLRILDALEKKINRHSYDTWLKPTRYSHSSNGIMYVRVPTAEFRHVGDKYADLIQEALDNLNMDYSDVQFVTPEDDPAATPVRHDGGLSAPP